MTRHLFIFFGTFVVGALIALGARTATHQPHSAAAAPTADPPAAPRAAKESSAAISDPKAQTPAPVAAGAPVNTHCAICGMAVDPKLPTLTYQGKTIGFGCKMCPPKFKAEPDKYGPAYLRNEIIKN